MVTVPTWGRPTTTTMMSVVVMRQVCRSGGCERSNRGYHAVVVRSSRYVNSAEEVCVPFLQCGGGMVALLLSAAEAHAVKGNVGDEESEEDNGGSLSSGGGKR